MDNPYIAAIGALGAWLLVAGPLYQASMNLREQGLAQSRQLPEVVSRPVSGWWWLLPPVAYWKHRNERERVRRIVTATLPTDQIERMVTFSNTARGWFIVAGGATLFGVKETWELVEITRWPIFLTWVITAAALLLSVGNAAITASRTGKILSVSGSEKT